MKLFAQKCTNDDIGLTLTFYGKIKFALRGFTWEEFIEFVKDLGAKVNKCSYINEYINGSNDRSQNMFSMEKFG